MDLSGYIRHARAQQGARPSAVPAADAHKPDAALSARALRLLASSGAVRRLHTVAVSYPHLLNRLADLWDVPESMERYLEELLLTGRADRRGFPSAVVNELTDLREKNRRRLAPVARDVWSETLLR